MWNLHLNLTQDIGHGITIIFVCCILVIVACLIDLWTGVDAARKKKEKIRSKALRRTVIKIRVIIFAVLIDVLGLAFPWYAIPYCAVICALGILIIEGKSVLENFNKKKSSAAKVVEVAEAIIECVDNETAERLIKAIKSDSKIRKEE